jgi:hypothetical protein
MSTVPPPISSNLYENGTRQRAVRGKVAFVSGKYHIDMNGGSSQQNNLVVFSK